MIIKSISSKIRKYMWAFLGKTSYVAMLGLHSKLVSILKEVSDVLIVGL